jgi:hypothetical protein
MNQHSSNGSQPSNVDSLFDNVSQGDYLTQQSGVPSLPPPLNPSLQNANRTSPKTKNNSTYHTPQPPIPPQPRRLPDDAATSTELPELAVGLVPPASAFGVKMLSLLLETLASTTTAAVASPFILIGSPYIAPWVFLLAIAICHKQKWLRARTIILAVFTGWAIALPMSPIFLMPLSNYIPTAESLKTRNGIDLFQSLP